MPMGHNVVRQCWHGGELKEYCQEGSPALVEQAGYDGGNTTTT